MNIPISTDPQNSLVPLKHHLHPTFIRVKSLRNLEGSQNKTPPLVHSFGPSHHHNNNNDDNNEREKPRPRPSAKAPRERETRVQLPYLMSFFYCSWSGSLRTLFLGLEKEKKPPATLQKHADFLRRRCCS